jgi:phosphatidate cytidylyltransferase
MSNLTQRILSAFFLIPFVVYLIFFSSDFILFFSLSLISSLTCFEFSNICLYGLHKKISFFISLLSGLLTYLIPFSISQPVLLPLFFALCFLLLPPFFMFSFSSLKNSLHSLSFSLFALFYCGVLTSFLSLTSLFNPENGRYLIFMLLLGTFLGDTGAYAFGRLFGKRKLAPKLSPGKTWVGAFGGFFLTFLSVLFIKFTFISSLSLFEILPLSFFLSLFCQLGDLVESFLKRGFDVKDSGRLIPGHGGLFDRIDALLFGAPVVFVFSYLR